ncbi:40S small subunit processome assembly factor 1 isoform X2 [Cetorhinus maximus]
MAAAMGESERMMLDDFFNRLYQCGEAAVSETKNKRGKSKLKGRKCKQHKTEEQTLCSEAQSVPCSTALPRTSDSLAKKAAGSPCRAPKCLVKLRAELLDSVGDCAVQVEETVEQNKVKEKVFNLERARLEVHRFGITGYRKEQQRVFEQQRAVMLGARPPKREYVNYKSYQEIMKNKTPVKPMATNSKSTLPRRKKEERRNKKSEIVPTGQVGRFKNGALILSDSDIKGIKTRAKSKHM